MASGVEGVLTLSISMRVSPEPEAIELLKKLGISGGALAPLTAPQMTDVNPNRWGEPMNRPKGTLAPRAGRRSEKKRKTLGG